MSMFKVFDVASSGMNAQSVRLSTIASNLANAQAAGTTPETTYHAKQPIFATKLIDAQQGINNTAVGVEVTDIVESDKDLSLRYEPGHPKANEDGYVYYPNVNVVEEMANMISTSRSYQSNVNIINTTKTMMQRTLMMGQ